MTFDDYFQSIAAVVATKSKDSTRVGCVIVGEDNQILSTGWNGFPRGVGQLPEREERPAKYDWTIHAECNAIANAARSGVSLKGSTAYVTHCPCKGCAGMLIQAGIKRVVAAECSLVGTDFGLDIAKTMFQEAGIELG